MSTERNTETDLRKWIIDAIEFRAATSNEEDWELQRLTTDELQSFINDLCDVYSEISKMSLMLEELQSNIPSTEALEDVLVKVEIRLDHSVHHWDHAKRILQARDLWLGDEVE
jgi:valyl-tRNA synthetase